MDFRSQTHVAGDVAPVAVAGRTDDDAHLNAKSQQLFRKPMDFDFTLDGFELLIAGDQFSLLHLGQRGSKGVGKTNANRGGHLTANFRLLTTIRATSAQSHHADGPHT